MQIPGCGSSNQVPAKPTVLMVEDSPSVRHLVRPYLRDLRIENLEAETGPAGLESVSQHEPKVVILGIGLPGIDGWEVLRRIRADPLRSETKPSRPAQLQECVVALVTDSEASSGG